MSSSQRNLLPFALRTETTPAFYATGGGGSLLIALLMNSDAGGDRKVNLLAETFIDSRPITLLTGAQLSQPNAVALYLIESFETGIYKPAGEIGRGKLPSPYK